MSTAAFVARFWSHVDKDNGPIHPTLGRCWIWTGGLNRRGYGEVSNRAGLVPGSGTVRANRLSYFLDRGAMPGPGLCVMHLCHRKACVRPDHLKEGTAKQNAEDSVKEGHFRRGSGHHAAKLAESQVVEIRERRARGESPSALAAEFGVSTGAASSICVGRKWVAAGGPLVAPMNCGRRRLAGSLASRPLASAVSQ